MKEHRFGQLITILDNTVHPKMDIIIVTSIKQVHSLEVKKGSHLMITSFV